MGGMTLAVLLIAAGWAALVLAFLAVDVLRERRRERKAMGNSVTRDVHTISGGGSN